MTLQINNPAGRFNKVVCRRIERRSWRKRRRQPVRRYRDRSRNRNEGGLREHQEVPRVYRQWIHSLAELQLDHRIRRHSRRPIRRVYRRDRGRCIVGYRAGHESKGAGVGERILSHISDLCSRGNRINSIWAKRGNGDKRKLCVSVGQGNRTKHRSVSLQNLEAGGGGDHAYRLAELRHDLRICGNPGCATAWTYPNQCGPLSLRSKAGGEFEETEREMVLGQIENTI